MREIRAQGQLIPVSQQVHDMPLALDGAVPRLLDGLDRLRPELGTLADELIALLSDNAPDVGISEPGAQEV